MAVKPIESNPEVYNKLLQTIGVPTKYKIHDVLGTEEKDVGDLPGTLKAILLLLPKDDFYKEALAQKGSETGASDVMFIHHTGDNMCGTVALIHAVANGFVEFLVKNIFSIIFLYQGLRTWN